MDQTQIAQSYNEAIEMVSNARRNSAKGITAIWAKLERIGKYLERQAEAELAETLQ